MKAVVLDESRRISVQEVAAPTPADGEVLIAVQACGICGTDLHALPEVFVNPGVVMGHEFVGKVVELGGGVGDIEVGTLVVVNPTSISCGTCASCALGKPNQCEWANTVNGIGLGRDGGLAEFVAVERSRVTPLPADLDPVRAALIEPLAVASRGVRRAGVGEGDAVAVLGAGPVGLLAAAVAKARAAGRVAIFEPSPGRRTLAGGMGFDVVADPSQAESMRSEFDVVIDCSGTSKALASAIVLAKPGGRVMTIGWHTQPIVIEDTATAHSKELTFLFTLAYDAVEDFQSAIDLLTSGRLDVDSIISDVVPLESAMDAFERMRSGDQVAKILIDCSARRRA